MEKATTLTKIIYRLIQLQNRIGKVSTVERESNLQILEYHSVVSHCQNLIADLPANRWHKHWRRAIRWVKKRVPLLHPDTIHTVAKELRRRQEKEGRPPPQGMDDPPDPSNPLSSFEENPGETSKGALTAQTPDPGRSARPCRGELISEALPDPQESQSTSQSLTNLHPPKRSGIHIRSLKPTRSILILGDNNIRILPCVNPNIQMEVLPDTKLYDAIRILRKGTPTSPEVQKVILSFGLDDRGQTYTAIMKKQLNQLVYVAQKTFPNALILIPVINFSPNLPHRVRRTISFLNHLIREILHPIPRIPRERFQTEADDITWTRPTAALLWEHWKQYLEIQDETHIRPTIHSHVANLSSLTLTQPQLELLSKGLSFVPSWNTGRNVRRQLTSDVTQYHRRLKLLAHYGPDPEEQTNRLPFISPSLWEPDRDKLPPELLLLIQMDSEHLPRLIPKPDNPNLSPDEVEALQHLARNRSIVIKPADKGGKAVILNRTDYIKEGYRQLNDPKYYRKLPTPIYHSTATLISSILDTLKKSRTLNSKQIEYLKGEPDPKPRRFYLLPKIHKPPEMWPEPFHIPAGRPIVSDCGSESYRTAEFIEFFLNPLSTKHKSYLRDTKHFVEKVRSISLKEPCFLFSMDVESLYTNIDTSRGMQIIQQYLEKYPDPARPDRELLQLLHINLTRNDFQFNNEYFLQLSGTAMGKKNLLHLMLTYTWPTGKKQPFSNAPFYPSNTSATLTISGESGNTHKKSLTNLSGSSIHTTQVLNFRQSYIRLALTSSTLQLLRGRISIKQGSSKFAYLLNRLTPTPFYIKKAFTPHTHLKGFLNPSFFVLNASALGFRTTQQLRGNSFRPSEIGDTLGAFYGE